jgi:hypothetical protein
MIIKIGICVRRIPILAGLGIVFNQKITPKSQDKLGVPLLSSDHNHQHVVDALLAVSSGILVSTMGRGGLP